MSTRKRFVSAVFVALWVVSATAQAQVVQTNQRLGSLNISGTRIDSSMLANLSSAGQRFGRNGGGYTILPLPLINEGPTGPPVLDANAPIILGANGGFAPVPERSTISMIMLGAGVLLATMRFRQRRRA